MELLLSGWVRVTLNHRVKRSLLQDVVSHCLHGVVLFLSVLVKLKLGKCLLVQLMGLSEVSLLDLEVIVLLLSDQKLDVLYELQILLVTCLPLKFSLLLLDC